MKIDSKTDFQEIQSQITSVWKVEQEILDVIHEICETHGLRYSLAYGTLLGAVRHKGFIPWDDDIDIMMPRQDYDKLLEIWNDVAPNGYLLMNGNTAVDCSENFTKIVKDKTTFLQHEEDRCKDFHKGIFVDIFPGDLRAPSKLDSVLQYCACAVNLLYSRGYTSKSGGVIEFGEKILLRVPHKYHRNLREKAQRFASKWNNSTDLFYMFPCTIKECKKNYAADLFNNLECLEFNGKSYKGTARWDSYLTTCYGDYMQLPPEEDRVWKHHPILIDLNHNYEELSG